MPTLKHLTCHVEWSSSNIPLEEYNTTYADGLVSTYIAIPSTPTPFSIHLTSHGYIAPGLAMFVYMDGVYQVNRNRHNLKIPGEGTKRSHTEVDFRVRQKEELLWDGSFEGKEWRFERANIVDSPSGEGKQRAPHDGEYVGTIEVVVLRCLPAANDMGKSSSTSSRTAKYRQMKDGSSTSSDEPSDTDHPRFPGVYDGPVDSYPALTRRPQAKQPKHKFNSRNQYSLSALGLDGSWDGDNEAKSTTGDEFDWDKPTPPPEEQISDTKGSWADPSSPIAEAKDKALDSWDNPPLPKEEEAKTNTWGAWSDKPASPPAGERKDKGAWGAWDVLDVPKKESTKGRIEMTSATTGVWHPSSQAATSAQDSGNGSTPCNSGGSGSTRTETTRTRGRHSRTSSNHQHGPVMRLRGGAPGSYNVSTPGTGHQTPTVIVNINNGPPPPTDWMAEAKKEREQSSHGPSARNGPPPPSDWAAEAKKEREQSKGKKSPNSPASPANDLWTDDLPPYDPSQDSAVNGNEDDNGNGDWGRNGNGQQMPGTWDDSGNDGWGNTNGGDNFDWNASGNDNDKDNNDSSWDNPGNDPFQDPPKDDAKTNNDGWGNNNDTQQNDDWNASGDNQDTSWGAADNNDNVQQDTSWGADADNKDQQNNSWGNEDNKENDSFWGADKTEPEAKAGSTDPVARKKSDSKAASQFSFGNSKPKQSKAGSVKSKVSANTNNKGWSFNAITSLKKSKKGTPKSVPVPGAWSPPPAFTAPVSPPPSPRSKKNQRSKASSSPKSSPTLNSPTPRPHPKPYWSTWRIPHSPFTDSPLKQEPPPPPPPCEDPLYPVPRAVARRHGTSHQVQPGKAAPYMHKKNKPQYMDGMESPYAVFEFRYRDKETLERLLSHALPPEPPAHEKLRLRSLSKNELIDEFIKQKTKLSSTSSQATPKPTSTTSKSNKSNSRKASASTASTKAATLRSNPNGIQESPDINALDERLRKLETSKTESEGEGVKGWLEGTGESDWGGNGNGNDEGTKDTTNGGGSGNGGRNSGNGDLGGIWGASTGGGNTKKTKNAGKANAKANNKKGKEKNGNADFNAWGTGSAWDAKDEDKDNDDGGGNGNGNGNGNSNGNDWNDTSGGDNGNGDDWGATSGDGDAGGGGGGGW